MTGDDLAREVQARCDARVAEAVAAERQRIADELRALLLDRPAFHAWLAAHGLGDPGLGAGLAVLMRDLRGTCSLCGGPAAFVGKSDPATAEKSPPEPPPTARATTSP